MELSGKQYEKIWLQTVRKLPSKPNVGTAVEGGRAAVDAVLAEVLPVVLAEPNQNEVRDAICAYQQYVESHSGEMNRSQHSFSVGIATVLHSRLARFTAPKDAAVERLVGPRFRMADGTLAQLSQEAAELIADTVRAADREAGR